jgi:hypothetical protein
MLAVTALSYECLAINECNSITIRIYTKSVFTRIKCVYAAISNAEISIHPIAKFLNAYEFYEYTLGFISSSVHLEDRSLINDEQS